MLIAHSFAVKICFSYLYESANNLTYSEQNSRDIAPIKYLCEWDKISVKWTDCEILVTFKSPNCIIASKPEKKFKSNDKKKYCF